MENRNIIYYEKTDSTNMRIEELAEKGATHGTIVVAEEQTMGKGRRGRNWESPAEGNIYMSILLRPQIQADKASMLTLVMAYSVAQAVRGLGHEELQIKWPNDLVLSRKKVCGILTEMHLKGTEIDYVVIGVGVNANVQHFSQDLGHKATSLYLESGKMVECKQLIRQIVERFEIAYQQFMEKKDLSFLKDAYNGMLINCEREVQVLEPGNAYIAYAKGIDCNGQLLVRTADGKEKAVFAGEVSVRGVYGYV